jgi:tRNA (guanine-N7-)-methyltransferase
MRGVLDHHPAFSNEHRGSWAPRWEARPITRFERRAIAAGRQIFDLAYRRV